MIIPPCLAQRICVLFQMKAHLSQLLASCRYRVCASDPTGLGALLQDTCAGLSPQFCFSKLGRASTNAVIFVRLCHICELILSFIFYLEKFLFFSFTFYLNKCCGRKCDSHRWKTETLLWLIKLSTVNKTSVFQLKISPTFNYLGTTCQKTGTNNWPPYVKLTLFLFCPYRRFSHLPCVSPEASEILPVNLNPDTK